MRGSIRHRLPPQSLELEQSKMPLQRRADDFASGAARTFADFVQDGRQLVVDPDCDCVSFHV
jgi:hypothetical protein